MQNTTTYLVSGIGLLLLGLIIIDEIWSPRLELTRGNMVYLFYNKRLKGQPITREGIYLFSF